MGTVFKSGKANMSDLFKNGEDFEFTKIDWSSRKMTRKTKNLEKIKAKIRKGGEVDLNRMREIVFNI